MNKIDTKLLGVLLRKQLNETFSFKKRGKKPDVFGIVLQAFLAVAIAAVFLVFFFSFAKMYLGLSVRGVTDPYQRQYELMTVFYCVLLIALIVSAVSNINSAIFKSDDIKILSALPINSQTLFASKLATIYIKQLVYTFFAVLAVNVTPAIILQQSAWYFVFSAISVFLIPLVSIAVASLFALPYHYVRAFVHTHFIAGFIIITIVTVAAILLYAALLDALRQILVGNELKFFFSNAVMDSIAAFVAAAYPVNFIINLLFARDVVLSAIVIALLIAAAFIVAMFIIKKLFTRALQNKISTNAVFKQKTKKSFKQKSVFSALVAKEFNNVLRTPSYAFSYFSVAVAMPLMVYFCMSIGLAMLKTLVFSDASFELALFLTAIFGVLTNTFCSTNISRDGEVFYSVKAMPVYGKKVLSAKVVFCFIVTAFSNIASAIVLFATSLLSLPQAIFVCLVGLLLGFAQICFATKKDFMRPCFSSEEDGVIRESSNTLSVILVIGLVVASVMGAALVYISLVTNFGSAYKSPIWSYLISGGLALVLALLSYLYLLYKLDKRYADFNGGF